MKKTFITKIISAGAIATTIATLAPLGVSAAWKESTNNTTSYVQNNQTVNGWKQISGKWYYFDANGKMKTGWIYDKGAWYYTDSTGAMQTGVLKINGKTYYLNKSGAMQIGRIVINNKVYIFASNGQATGTIPGCDKEFNSNNQLVKPNNGGTTNNNTNNNGTNNNTNSNTNNSTNNNTNKDETVSGGTTNNGNTNSGSNSGTTSNESLNVSGLPQITQKYETTIQSSAETEILRLMNEKRTEAGLQPLTMDNTLLTVARYKSNHMIQNNYFSHTNPDGTKWTAWLQALGYKYTTTGENIAYNTSNAVELFNQWWNSQGHRDNMMNPNYTKVGVGVVLGNGKYMGTQTFSN